MFKAILVNKDDQGYRAELAQVDEVSLPEGDVRVKMIFMRAQAFFPRRVKNIASSV